MDSRTSWSFAGSFEYRFNRVAGLEIEATAVPTLKSDSPGVSILASSGTTGYMISSLTSPASSITSSLTIFPQPQFVNRRGRAVIFTNNVRVHIPTTANRVDPYFVAGGGIANVRRTADLVFGPITLPPGLVGVPLPFPTRSFTEPFSSSSVDLALTLGGGLGVRAASRLWIDADLRLFRLLGDADRNAGRFGVGVRYTF